VDPIRLDPNWNMSARMNRRDPATLIQAEIDSGSFYEFISDLKPRDEFYNHFRNDVYSRDEAVLEDLNSTFKPAGRLVEQSAE